MANNGSHLCMSSGVGGFVLGSVGALRLELASAEAGAGNRTSQFQMGAPARDWKSWRKDAVLQIKQACMAMTTVQSARLNDSSIARSLA
mmetsp:Transcript_177684/g.432306  ORF Transcript_177684/g.432306 Transcript_177684/m.432306 type:complete len:89 (-) Transcript_177684:200-466(-)